MNVSCENSRAERVGPNIATSFTAVNIVYERKRRIRPGGGAVSLSASPAERARLRLPREAPPHTPRGRNAD